MISLEKKYLEKTITEEETAQYKKILWIRKGILLGLYFLMIILSFVWVRRVSIFFNVLGGGKFSFYAVAIVLFYLTLFLTFGYFTFQISYMVYSEIKKKDWLSLISKLNIKLDIVSFLCKCLSILLFIMIYMTTPCTVVGNSMNDTLHNGDRLLCTDLFYSPHQGDIIVFIASQYTKKLYGNYDDKFFIKRIVAVSGDKLTLSEPLPDSFTFYVNDVECPDVSKTEFIKIRESAGITEDKDWFKIPDGMVMVMGDNREPGESCDSRSFGLIYASDIFGKVYMRIFPFSFNLGCTYHRV
jgi:signal peptidase I